MFILCSSADYFRSWMNKQLGDDRYLVGIVGDLTEEEEALEFFKQQLLLGRPSKFVQSYKVPDYLWKEIFVFLGGRVNTLKLLANELTWDLDDEKEMVSTRQQFKHPWWTKALADVKVGFDPANIEEKWALRILGARVSNLQEAPSFTIPLWIAEEYEALLGEMGAAKEGILSVDSLPKVISKKANYNLIQHNLLHYRDVGC
ncbi:hypothetical protein L7F22_005260 [Adiantum nelumboides]|nr:hypothetical protein [Adiantum nelumboides]